MGQTTAVARLRRTLAEVVAAAIKEKFMDLITWLLVGRGRKTPLGRALDQNIGYLDESDGVSLGHLPKEEQGRRRANFNLKFKITREEEI